MMVFCEHLVLEHQQQQLKLPKADQGNRYWPSGKAAWTVHHNTNLTWLGQSPPASQAGLRVGSSLYSLRLIGINCLHVRA
jgi:hypothetical protein